MFKEEIIEDNIIYIIFVFFTGLIFGSFFNVCIYRIPKKLSVFYPARSFCPRCKKVIKWYDNIPIFSFILLRGRCRNCNSKIPLKYPIIEFITALLFILFFIKFGLEKSYFLNIIIIGFLLIFSVIDFERQIVLDNLLLVFIFTGLFLCLTGFNNINILNCISGFISGGVIIFLLNFFSNGKIGEGDIKFLAGLGLWLGTEEIVYVIFYSFIIGGFISAILLISGKKQRHNKIAFIPFVALAFISRIFIAY